ncbi:hypothetical protein M405DRAFT_861041 [Rhizopogon salebrosus TDB-379]|nr:hypothetical protein M405DRAFT_861041 [Rhizopogon salebrosus TDB-379]
MSTNRYNFRPRQVNRALGPTPDLPGALPVTPTGLDSSLSEPESVVTPAVRAVRSYSDVVRASSPWNRPLVAKEIKLEQVSGGETVSVHKDTAQENNINDYLPSGNDPDSESSESDGDDRPWITVQRKSSRERLEKGGTNSAKATEPTLTSEQLRSVRKAEYLLSAGERDRIEKRRTFISSRAESRGEGPSKGKNPDPREWGAANLTEEELDADAQRAALESWNAAKALASEVGSEVELEEQLLGTDAETPGTLEAPGRDINARIGASALDIETLVEERAAKAIRLAEAKLTRKYEKKLRELNKKLEHTLRQESVPQVRNIPQEDPVQAMVGRVVNPLPNHRERRETPRAMQPVQQVTAQSYIGQALNRLQN